MKIYYNILTGFLFALVAILPAGEMQFPQWDNRRDGLVSVVIRKIRYYLQYDGDEQRPAIGGVTF